MWSKRKQGLLDEYAICRIVSLIMVALLSLPLIVSCTGLFGSEESKKPKPSLTYRIDTSVVQKGPFVAGSDVTVQALDQNYNPTGSTYSTQTQTDFGDFSLQSDIPSNIVEVITRGYYFNEITGTLSGSELTLRGIADLSDTGVVNVNLLTTLSKDRIVYLVTQGGKNFPEAKAQAETEILNALGMPSFAHSGFERMDISQEGDHNAVLLAVSIILQADNTVAELSEFISKLALDLRDNGAVNDQLLQTKLSEQAGAFTDDMLNEIRDNISNRYTDIGANVSVAGFEHYINTVYAPAETGSLRVMLDAGLSALGIAPAIELKAHHYRVTGHGPDGDSIESPSYVEVGKAVQFDDLAPGMWSLHADVFDSTGERLAEGDAVVMVVVGEVTNVRIAVKLLEGYGTLQLEMR